MNQAGLQAIINRGAGIAASIVGAEFDVYRPPNAQTSVESVIVQLDSKFDFKSTQPNLYGHPVWAANCDRTSLQVGDLLSSDAGSYFVIAMQPLLPTAVVEVNTTVTISNPGTGQAASAQYYAGASAGQNNNITQNWPASILQGAKGEADSSGVVGTPRLPWASILLPAIPGIILKTADILVDGYNRRWNISSVEITSAGYRLTAASANA